MVCEEETEFERNDNTKVYDIYRVYLIIRHSITKEDVYEFGQENKNSQKICHECAKTPCADVNVCFDHDRS